MALRDLFKLRDGKNYLVSKAIDSSQRYSNLITAQTSVIFPNPSNQFYFHLNTPLATP